MLEKKLVLIQKEISTRKVFLKKKNEQKFNSFIYYYFWYYIIRDRPIEFKGSIDYNQHFIKKSGYLKIIIAI